MSLIYVYRVLVCIIRILAPKLSAINRGLVCEFCICCFCTSIHCPLASGLLAPYVATRTISIGVNVSTPVTYDPDLLARLRKRLKTQGLEGFLVPHADAHQSEYLPACDERLLRLTGFSGSAGFAIVLQHNAAVFVDGRYTLQAADEVDARAFAIVASAQTRPAAWLKEQLRAAKPALIAGAKIGFDPWLHTPQGLEPILSVCREAQIDLVSLEDNPIDAEWADRPAPPASPIETWPHPYAALSSTAKLGIIAESLKKQGADAAVLCTGDAIAWTFNIRAADVPFTPLVLAFAIVTADAKAKLFVQQDRLDKAVREHLGAAVDVLPPSDLGEALDAFGKARAAVLVAPDVTATWIVKRLTDGGARTIQGDDPCLLPKASKQPAEIIGIKRAHVRDGVALVRFLAWLEEAAPKGGVTELSAARHLDALRGENDLFRGLSFPTISGSGPNGAIVHYRVTEQSDRELRLGELYLVDSGGQYLDGTTDVTRTVAIGKPTPEMKDRFTRVLKGHIAISSQRFPKGTQGQELDILARRALWDAGLDYDHGTGHGVGTYLGVHEGPQRIAKRGPGVELAVGMVLSNEPGYYKAKSFGIRIENLITVIPAPTPKGGDREMLGFEPLTLAPIDLHLIDVALLTETERAWLDDYHRHVRNALSPLVDPQTRAWLNRATQSLSASH